MSSTNPQEFINNLYANYYKEVVSYCAARLDGDISDAELCASEVFEQAVLDKEKLVNHPNIVGWLKVTAMNRVKRLYRNKTKKSNHEVHITDLSERYIDTLSYIDEFDAHFTNHFIDDKYIQTKKHQILNQLTEDEILLYNLRFSEKLTYKQISIKIGMSESSVRIKTVRLELKIKTMVSEIFDI